MLQAAKSAQNQLESTQGNWAQLFVELRMSFWHAHAGGLIFSTNHGPDFFKNVIECINGKEWKMPQQHDDNGRPIPEGEYEKNFRRMIQVGRQQK